MEGAMRIGARRTTGGQPCSPWRRLARHAAVLALCFALVACGGTGSGTGPASGAATSSMAASAASASAGRTLIVTSVLTVTVTRTLLITATATATAPATSTTVPGPSPTVGGSTSTILRSAPTTAGSTTTGQRGAGGASLRCALPVFGGMSLAANGQRRTAGGFVTFPAGAFQADPTSAVASDATTPGWYHTVQQPALPSNTPFATYDPPLQRWLPVPLAQVAADWTRYTYFTEPAQGTHLIHVVDIASGADRVVWQRGSYEPVDFEQHTLYLVHHLTGTDASDGLWTLDVTTGTLTQITASRQGDGWNLVGGGAAWASGGASVFHLDLADGSSVPWFERQGAHVSVLGFDDQGAPLLSFLDGNTQELWLAPARDGGKRLYQGPVLSSTGSGSAIGDAHGMWLAGELPSSPGLQHAVYLVLPGGGVERAVTIPWPDGQVGQAQIAGRCG